MARTEEGARLTRTHGQQQRQIRDRALRDLLALWAIVNVAELAETLATFGASAALVIGRAWTASATEAEGYVTEFRAAEGAGGSFAVQSGGPPDEEQVSGAVRAAGAAGIMHARRSGLDPVTSVRNGFARVAGTSSNLVLAGGRDVTTLAASTDRAGTGQWQRVTTSAEPCSFCRMLAGRGPVFAGQSAADFQAHGTCSCAAEPAFPDTQMPARSQEFAALWTRATRGLSGRDAENAFRRAVEGRSVEGDPILTAAS